MLDLSGLEFVYYIGQAVREAAARVGRGEVTAAEVTEETITRLLYTRDSPAPDLLIRTSGETRLSDFMLWQASKW